jgi:hypothetical protein
MVCAFISTWDRTSRLWPHPRLAIRVGECPPLKKIEGAEPPEGSVSKRRDRAYQDGRSKHWVKVAVVESHRTSIIRRNMRSPNTE